MAGMVARVLASACCALAIASPARAIPTVPNAGLEEGASAPVGWAWSPGEGGRGTCEWEAAYAHSGQRGLRVVHQNGTGYTLVASGQIAVEPGKTYLVSAWVRPSRNIRRGVYFMVSQYRQGGAELDLPNTFSSTNGALVGGTWQLLTVHVDVRKGCDRLCVQCVQAQEPTDVQWDDFAVTEAAQAPAPRYEPPAKEALPDLAPAKAILEKRPRAVVRVAQAGGRPRLVVDGKRVPWAFTVGPPGSPDGAHIADFRDAGVHVYCVPLILGRGIMGAGGVWRGRGQYDFHEVDELLWRVLRVDPHGYIVFYMGCDPYSEWGAENPNDVTWDQDGRKAIVDMHPIRWGDDPKPGERFGPSLVSQRLCDDTAETLRRLVRHVESSLPGKAVIGYHVAGSNDGQWFHWNRLDEKDLHLADYSPAATASYRAWLRRRYSGSVAALRKAWRQAGATFDNATVPPASREWADGDILDPNTQQDIADYTRFYSEGVTETVLHLAATIKKATPRRVICGTYHEDITCNSMNHIALGRYLASSAIDYFSGPAAYGIRQPGYTGAVRSVFGSTLLHGKVYLTEQDWRSWHSEPNSPAENFEWGRAETAEAHNAMVRRESGMMLAFGLGTWWYDMCGGWFHDPAIMSGIAEAMRAFQRDLQVDEMPAADLAVIVSEESNDTIAPKAGGTYRYIGILSQIEELNAAGVPYRLYLQSDLGRAKLPPHKAYLFLNAYRLTDVQRRAIDELKRDGRLLVFVHAPGVVGAADPARAIRAVTGFGCARIPGSTRLLSEPVPHGEGPPDLKGASVNLSSPLAGTAFEVDDIDAVPLAWYAGTMRVCTATRDFGKWKSAFVGCPAFTAEFVARLADWAGCWRAAEPGDAVYASDRFLTIHAVFPGHKVLRLHRASRIVDLTSGKVVSERAAQMELDVQRGETRWFALTPVR